MFETQIAKGVALLDAKVPGWLDRIDVDKLDLVAGEFPAPDDDPECGRPGCGCVLAQLDYDEREDGDESGDFLACAKRLGLVYAFFPQEDGPQHPALFGFTLPAESIATPNAVALFDTLTDEWKATILKLRAERSTEA